MLKRTLQYYVTGCLLWTWAGESTADDAVGWLTRFYDNRGICISSNTTPEVTAKDTVLQVQLTAEDGYAQRVIKGGDNIVRDWLALHCPLPMIAYSTKLQGKDVIIKFAEQTPLSCMAFEKSRR